MQLEQSFEVPAPPDQAWDILLDVEGIAPCMPGAELTEVVDGDTYKGKVTVKLGPVSLSYRGTVKVEERDAEARRVVLNAKGQETRGKGTAQAKVTATLEASGTGTRAIMVADLQITGAAAQYGRGMIADVSKKLTDEFARCLAERMTAAPETSPADAAAAETPALTRSDGQAVARPVSGLRLLFWALLRALGRLVAGLWRAVRGRR